jgi:Dolichyl-phosphate-mannose-protein mannosyltransferase
MNPTLSVDCETIAANAAPRRWQPHCTWLLATVLVFSTLAMTRGMRIGEFSYNVDETQHAVTGLFVADLIRDRPVSHLFQYVYEYYAQYPALSGVLHWPPLFYVFEGFSFLILGPTVLAARLTVLAFALAGITFWFLLVWELQNEWMAAAAALLLCVLPAVLVFEKTVMLEIPCLALSLGATYFWIRYLLRQRRLDIYWSAIFAAAALLTKQNAVYLIPFAVLSGLAVRGWRMFFTLPVLWAASLCAILITPFYCVVYALHWQSIAMDLTENSASRGSTILFYWQALVHELGWMLVLLAVIGMLSSRWWDRSAVSACFLSWIVACYGTFTLIGHKEFRYVLYWVPPFIYFALGPLICFFRKNVLRVAGAGLAVVLLSGNLAAAWTFRRPYVVGYEAAARCVTSASKAGIILYDGPLPGNFIFFVRANDSARRFLVLRKALYATRIKESGGSEELVHSPEEIEQLLRRDGVRFVVVSEGEKLHFKSQKMLRDLLANPTFRPLGQFHIEGTDVGVPNLNLMVYENTAWAPPTDRLLRIRMLTLSHDIIVPFDHFNFVEGQGQAVKPEQK